MGGRPAVTGYAVVDVETTGLFPGSHRIAEVAVVHVSADGEVERTWTTLLNPGRDLGPQHVHGIAAADVLDAPTFDRVAGTLAELLAGRVFVAHNASFDMRFIRAAYAELGHDVPVVPETSLCTMRWADQLLPSAPRTLAACCERAGIPLENAHAALVDATATAELLRHYLALVGCGVGRPWTLAPWADALELAATATWPAIPVHDVACCFRGNAGARATVPFLTRIVEHLPAAPGPAEHREYLALLDRALLDRYLSAREQTALVATAHTLGIDRTTAAALHRAYVRELAAAAAADGVVSDTEVADLRLVAQMLSVPAEEVVADGVGVRAGSGGTAGVGQAGGVGQTGGVGRSLDFRLRPGDRVVFTGEMSLPREEWTTRAIAAGLVPHPSVTKSVALVVAADPDSLSGKARKAEAYGIPIVTESAFATLLARIP